MISGRVMPDSGEAVSLGLLAARAASIAQRVVRGAELTPHQCDALSELAEHLEAEARLLRGELSDAPDPTDLSYAFTGVTVPTLRSLHGILAAIDGTEDTLGAAAIGDQLVAVARLVRRVMEADVDAAGHISQLFDEVSSQIRSNVIHSGSTEPELDRDLLVSRR